MPKRQPKKNQGTRITRQNSSSTSTSASHNPAGAKTMKAKSRPTHPGQPKSSITDTASDQSSTSSDELETPKATPTKAKPAKQHKAVNHKSTNRRTCKRASDNVSLSTPEQNNLSQRKHAHTTRVTFKMTCIPSDDAEKMILSIFEEFIEELTQADPTAAILPWKSIHRSQGSISKTSEVPKNTKALRTYLNKFYINRTPNKQFTTYPGVHIGHDITLSELREEMQLWLQDGDHGLFYKMLQVEDSSEIGWLLYSTQEMDAGALVDEISELVGIQVGLRWKIIDIGAKGNLPESQRIRALNVEVNARNRWIAQRKLIIHFGRNPKGVESYPNGIRLRFVKSKKDAINPVEKGKIERLRARQKSFLQNIVSMATWDIIQLDYSPDTSQPTLRQMIMDMTTKEGNIPLFHCVDLDWRGEGFVFQCAPAVKIEAECTIQSLLPILSHHYPDADLEQYFSQEAIDRCDGYRFDAEQGIVVDGFVNDHLTFVDEENLLGFTFNNETAEELEVQGESTRPSAANQQLYNDSDSVSTLAKPGTSNFLTPSINNNISFARADNRSNDNTSITSNASTVTMETVSMMIESKISTLTTHVQNNEKKFDELMNYLRSTNGGHPSSATIQNCTSNNSNDKAGEDSSVSGNVQ
jgi:hypothetical protein